MDEPGNGPVVHQIPRDTAPDKRAPNASTVFVYELRGGPGNYAVSTAAKPIWPAEYLACYQVDLMIRVMQVRYRLPRYAGWTALIQAIYRVVDPKECVKVLRADPREVLRREILVRLSSASADSTRPSAGDLAEAVHDALKMAPIGRDLGLVTLCSVEGVTAAAELDPSLSGANGDTVMRTFEQDVAAAPTPLGDDRPDGRERRLADALDRLDLNVPNNVAPETAEPPSRSDDDQRVTGREATVSHHSLAEHVAEELSGRRLDLYSPGGTRAAHLDASDAETVVYSPEEINEAAETINGGIAELFLRIGPPPSSVASRAGSAQDPAGDGNSMTPVGTGSRTGSGTRG